MISGSPDVHFTHAVEVPKALDKLAGHNVPGPQLSPDAVVKLIVKGLVCSVSLDIGYLIIFAWKTCDKREACNLAYLSIVINPDATASGVLDGIEKTLMLTCGKGRKSKVKNIRDIVDAPMNCVTGEPNLKTNVDHPTARVDGGKVDKFKKVVQGRGPAFYIIREMGDLALGTAQFMREKHALVPRVSFGKVEHSCRKSVERVVGHVHRAEVELALAISAGNES